LSNHHLRRFLGLLTGGSSEFPGRVARSWHFPGVERPYVIEYSFTEFNVFGGKTVFPGTVAVSNSRPYFDSQVGHKVVSADSQTTSI
jgi:hypothetical protein